jgi:hypothetical protein
MKWFDDATERLLRYVATHASNKGIVAVMTSLYVGVGLFLPIALGSTGVMFVSLNVIGVVSAFTFGLAWFAVRVEATHRRHLVEWTSDLRLLDAREFEWLVGEVFRREGWKVDEVGAHGSPDGNIDLRMTRGVEKAIVQCKRWTSRQVGVDQIRGFAGTLKGEGSAGTTGCFVTLSGFSEQAMTESKRLGIVVMDGVELYKRAETLRRREPCPTCGSSMILDRSARGWWFRCIAAGCTGKRDLGSEPGRAVELLTEVAS